MSLRLRVNFPLRKCMDAQESEAVLDEETREKRPCSQCVAI